MPGANYNLLDTDMPAKVGGSFNLVGAWNQGRENALGMQARQQAIALQGMQMQQGQMALDQEMQTRNALEQGQGQVTPELRAANPKLAAELEKMDLEKKKGELDKVIKIHTIRSNSAGLVTGAPDGMVLQTAFQQADEVAGLVGGDATQAKMKLKAIWDQGGDEALRKAAFEQSLDAKDRIALHGQELTALTAQLNREVQMRGQDMQFQGQLMQNLRSVENEARSLKAQGLDADGNVGVEGKALAELIAAYKSAPLTGFALARPGGQAVMGEVARINPDYDATTYAAKLDSAKKFASGAQGNQLRSFATAVTHLDQLGGLISALENKDTQAINAAKNKISAWTGGVAPTNFDAVKGVISKEVIKAIVASGGGVEERQELAQLLKDSKSPKQLKGIVEQYQYLMEAQQVNLMEQRSAAGVPEATLPSYEKPGKEAHPEGWILHEDASGNKAYVSPDGTQFQEVE